VIASAVILFALVCLLLWVYQRFVGLRSGSLALIAQSVDSRNHVIVAASVTAGLVASLLRFGLLDTFVGLAVPAQAANTCAVRCEITHAVGDTQPGTGIDRRPRVFPDRLQRIPNASHYSKSRITHYAITYYIITHHIVRIT
jgi:hypothetical protein